MLDPEEARRSRAAIDALGDEIALTACRLDAAQQVLLTHIRAFDQAGGWAWQGAKSCAAWLSWRIGCGRNAANEKVRVATALGALPLIDAAFGAGELSYCKVRAMTRVATADNEGLLLDQARSATGAELERICASVRQVLRPPDAPGDDDVRYVRRRHTGLGMTRIEAQLYADEAERVWQALAAVRRDLESAPTRRAGTPIEPPVDATCVADTRLGDEASRPDDVLVAAIAACPDDALVGAIASNPDDAPVAAIAARPDDALVAATNAERGAPIVIDGYTYGEASPGGVSAGALAEIPNDHASSSFRGNDAARIATPDAPESLEWAPRSDRPPMGRPGLADALVAVAEVALRRGIGSRSRPAAERRQLLVHLTEDRLAELCHTDARPTELCHADARPAALCYTDRPAELCHTEDRSTEVAHASSDPSPVTITLSSELHHGVRLGAETLLRIACDAGLVVAKTSAEGDVLDIGRRSRTITAPLLRALWMRDRGCRFPGCTQVAFVEGHHIDHWTRGGATSLANTALLCHHHHVSVHEGGFRMERDAHGALSFADPDGRPIPAAPAPPSLDEPTLAAFARTERERGIAITYTTSLIRRDLGRPDLRGAANAVIACTLGPHM